MPQLLLIIYEVFYLKVLKLNGCLTEIGLFYHMQEKWIYVSMIDFAYILASLTSC